MNNLFVFLLICGISVHAFAQEVIYVSTDTYRLYSINVATCDAQHVMSFQNALLDIAIDPTTGLMYGVDWNFNLHKVDLDAQTSSVIGVMTHFINALVFSSSGVLYGVGGSSDQVFEIDVNTGTSHLLGSTGTGIYSGGDMFFFNGNLYYTGGFNELIQIDLGNLSNSSVVGAFSSLVAIYGVGYSSCKSKIYAFSGSDVHALNNSNLLQSALVCSNLFPDIIYGAAVKADVYDLENFNLGNDTMICANQPLTLDASISGASYTWQDGSDDAYYTVSEAGTYSVEISTYCEVIHDTIEIEEWQFHLSTSSDTTICRNDTIELSAFSNGDGYSWNTGESGDMIQVNTPGEYRVEAHNYCGSITDTIRVSLIPDLAFSLGADTSICIQASLTFDFDLENIHYLWQDYTSSSYYQIQDSGTYWLKMENQCETYVDSLVVYTEDCSCEWFVPSAFTPNGDGLNDEFLPIIECPIESYLLRIYNRWGNLVFESTDQEFGWRAEELNNNVQDVYTYQIQYNLPFERLKEKSGSIVMLGN